MKSYEILQNLLNSRLYSEPIALPLEYSYPSSQYYGLGRKKRSSDGKNLKANNLR